MKFLFLDDSKERHKIMHDKYDGVLDITYLFTAKETIDVLKTDTWFDVICLDHDLEGMETGMDVVRFIVKQPPTYYTTRVVIIHSVNEACAREMERTLHEAGFIARRDPFSSLYLSEYV